jgi:hypothetical protein
MALPGIVLILAGLILLVKAYQANLPADSASFPAPLMIAEEVVAATPNIFLDAVTNSAKQDTPVANVLPESQFEQYLAAGQPMVAFFHSNNCIQCVKMIEVVEQVYPDFTGVVKQLQSLGRWSPLIEKASGVIILGVGLYFLWIA